MSIALIAAIYPKPIPWPLVLQQIYSAGGTRYRVAKILGVGQSTVEGWEDGAEPRHAMGESLLELRDLYCPGLPRPVGSSTPEKRCNGLSYKT